MPPKKAKKVVEKEDSEYESETESSSDEEEEKIVKKPIKVRTEDVKYLKLTQHQQILIRPAMWVGSNKPKTKSHWLKGESRIEKKVVTYTDAGIRVFIEPLSNAMDNIWRSKQYGINCSKITVDIDQKTGETSIYNDGKAITIKKYVDPETKEVADFYQQQLIFGELNSGSNYDDTEEKETSGQNGLGVKLCNIFALKFRVESYDPESQKIYTQNWSNNMYDREKPVIKKMTKDMGLAKGAGYTRVTWTPDFEKLGLGDKYTDDVIAIYMKYVCDVAMIAAQDGVDVYFNEEKIEIHSLKDYAFMYCSEIPTQYLEFKSVDCEVVLLPWDDDEFMHMSFVNGICTYNGGIHVDKWSREILNPVMDKINGVKSIKKEETTNGDKKKTKTKEEKDKAKKVKEKIKKDKAKVKAEKPTVDIKEVKRHFAIFINAKLNNPSFDSQEKTELTGPDVTVKTKKTDLGKIMKWDVIENIKDKLAMKDMKKLDSLNRSKDTLLCLDDANFVKNPSKRKDCILCAVEGNSARGFVVAGCKFGIKGKVGRDYIGILTCRGNFLNPREGSVKRIEKNEEAKALIRAFNLRADVDYTDPKIAKTLRYGIFMAVSDADEDGKHICGLWYNFFEWINPSVLKIPGFFNYMRTPVLVINMKESHLARLFYFTEQGRKWLSTVGKKVPHSKIGRYKGLGSIEEEDVERFFGKKIVELEYEEESRVKLNAIFGKGSANSDRRKEWIGHVEEKEINLEEEEVISITTFLDYEMKDFSKDHCRRAIPSIYDGLIESQRKILYTAFLRKLKKPIKVAQFAGSVSEKSSYHHGEQILYNTITHMAQTFVGSNNITLLYAKGRFGTRDMMGEDAASGRYIFTHLDKLTRLIYPVEDDPYLKNLDDDGMMIEKEYYVPIIPMVLVNGSMGIGTGYSTKIPCFNPLDIIVWIREWLDRDEDELVVTPEIPSFHPWYRGFNGTIIPEMKSKKLTGSYLCYGNMEKIKEGVYRITEIPVGTNNKSINDYRTYLDELEELKKIKSYEKHSGSNTIDFIIHENKEGLMINLETEESTYDTLERFGLMDRINTSNMTVFKNTHKTHDTIKKYRTVDEIMEEFCVVRRNKYDERLKGDIKETEHNIAIIKCKIRFITEVNEGKLILKNRSDEDLDAELIKKKYLRNTKESYSKEKDDISDHIDEDEDVDNKEDDEDEDEEKGTKPLYGYRYLVDMKYRSALKSKLDVAEKESKRLEERLKILKKMTPDGLWLQELEVLEKAYIVWEKETNNLMFSQKKMPPLAKSKKGKK